MLHEILTSVFPAVVLATALLALFYFALRHSVGTVALLLAVWIVTAALRDSFDLSITVSGVNIFALDVLSLVMLVIGVTRLLSDGVRNLGRGLVFALVLLLVFHLARGAAQFGTQTAVTAARGWLYFVAALVYSATIPDGWDRRVWKILTAAGVLLAAVAVPYFVLEGIGTATQSIFRNGEWVTTRPLAAAGALLILQSAILAPALRWPSKQMAVYVALGAGAVTLLLEHRTVWVAGLVVGVVGFVWWSAREIRESEATVFAATGVLILALPIAIWSFAQTGPLVSSVKEATSSNSTFTYRTTSWNELLSSHHSDSELILGQPAGGNFKRSINGVEVDTSPHDGFVDAYLRFGLPGVLILCWLGLLLWYRRFDIAQASGLSAQALGLLLLTELVFSVAYTLDSIQGVIAGILVSQLAVVSVRAPAASRSASPRPEHALQ